MRDLPPCEGVRDVRVASMRAHRARWRCTSSPRAPQSRGAANAAAVGLEPITDVGLSLAHAPAEFGEHRPAAVLCRPLEPASDVASPRRSCHRGAPHLEASQNSARRSALLWRPEVRACSGLFGHDGIPLLSFGRAATGATGRAAVSELQEHFLKFRKAGVVSATAVNDELANRYAIRAIAFSPVISAMSLPSGKSEPAQPAA